MSKPKKPSRTVKRAVEKEIDTIVFTTSTERFQAYWKEMKRHEAELARIYGKDTKHECKAEVVGSVRQVHDNKVVVQFKRCCLCLRDME